MALNEPGPTPLFSTEPCALRLADITDGLAPTRLGTRFHYFPTLDSTNDYARALAERGAPEGEVVIAEQQTAGRGRLGRRWLSPPHVNIYCSIILRPTIAAVYAPQITLTMAVALADAVASFSPVATAIKWPNDILVGEKKIAGVLTEAVSNGQRLDFVIVGIGVNVNFSRESMPAEIRERATSLSTVAGKSVSREAFTRRLIQDLDRCYSILEERGFAALAPRWQARFAWHGRLIRVEMTDQTLIGRAVGIDADGALLVEYAGGRQRVLAGDIVPVEK